MIVSQVLKNAWALINQTGAHSKRAPARNGELEAVHALHESATSWDSTGAVQKAVGEMDGLTVENCIRCLRFGAMKVQRELGVIEINDHGTPDDLQAMWAFAIRTAENVEQQMAAVTA